MATAKEFRQAIAAFAKEAIETYPETGADDLFDFNRRVAHFLASLSGRMHADEPEIAVALWRVLHPNTPYPSRDGA